MMRPSEWAEKYRELFEGETNEPGRWRNSRAPYLGGFMDICGARFVNRVNVMKAGQIGFSEATRNLMGMWAHLDPDPCGLALPDKEKGRKIVRNRIIPMFQRTPCLRGLFTSVSTDIQQGQLQLLNGFIMHLMWAGSPSSTSSDPMRRVINDEVDKAGFSTWSGGEPSAVMRTWKRMRTYGDRKLQINLSTPTNSGGTICTLFNNSTFKLYWMVACPICGFRQRLIWRQLRWEKIDDADLTKRAAHVLEHNAAWYECVDCDGTITPDMKKAMIRGGYYGTLDGSITRAEDIKVWPRGTSIGIHVGALNCLWEEWSDIVAEFILATHDQAAMFNFRTETLGEPWEDSQERTSPSIYADKCLRATLEEGVVPKWTARLLATVDTQHDHFYGVIRAWGPEMRSQRVWHGRLANFEDVERVCLQQVWPNESTDRTPMRPDLLLIDSGGTKLAGEQASRTMQVYNWANQRRDIVRPVKGASKPREGQFYWEGRGYLDSGRLRRGKKRPTVRLWLLDTNHFQDLLAAMIEVGTRDDDEDGTERWMLNKRNDPEYNWHMANMHRTTVQTTKGLENKWMPVEAGAPEHMRDCEVYQVAAAYMAMIQNLPTLEAFVRYQNEQTASRRRREEHRATHSQDDAWGIRPLK